MRDGFIIISEIAKLKLNNEYIGGTNLEYKPAGIRWDGPPIGPFKKVSDMIS